MVDISVDSNLLKKQTMDLNKNRNKKKIAIVGGGAAGTAAAWALQDHAKVSLFEMSETLGGHAYNCTVEDETGKCHIDMGVELFSEKLAPNLCAFFEILELETFVTPLAFSAIFERNKIWHNRGAKSQLWFKCRHECDRFHRDMLRIVQDSSRFKKLTLGEFLKQHDYTEEFTHKFIKPLLTTFSGCNANSFEYSLLYTAVSFSMGLLSFFNAGYWRKLSKGVGDYYEKLTRKLDVDLHLSTKVISVRRIGKKIILINDKQERFEFDNVIMATHADISLNILESPTKQEEKLLSQFSYIPVKSVLHSDATIILASDHEKMYCEYREDDLKASQHANGMLTRINNCLEPYANVKTPLLVTFDPKVAIAKEKIHCIKHWKLPKCRPMDLYRKTLMHTIQGEGGVWYCGTDFSYTGHEGAFVSGLVVANALGADYHFENNIFASMQFYSIKNLMNIRSWKEKWLSKGVSFGFSKMKKSKSLYPICVASIMSELWL
jgi:uncharacterized protein